MTIPQEVNQVTHGLPTHLSAWQLPPGWTWGTVGVTSEYRHSQEVHDALGRSLALVTAPDPAHYTWLEVEARQLAHRTHPAVPTTYHYWTFNQTVRRGPGYLRRWIEGETVAARIARLGVEDVPSVLQVLRAAGSALAYLHDQGTAHGALAPATIWLAPTRRLWLLGWQWAVPRDAVPAGIAPDRRWIPAPPEWGDGRDARWTPDALSDQWQLAAVCFAMLTGELPPHQDIPPVRLVRPECPVAVARVIDQALLPRPEDRHRSVGAMVRAIERTTSTRRTVTLNEGEDGAAPPETDEGRLRWALGDDYEVQSPLGSGTFGSVWRVRDLSLEREVALKMLHPAIARDDVAVGRFRREAQLAAQLAHPAIVPIYDWDRRGDVAWYTMELSEGGSVADLIARTGPRLLWDIAPQVELVLDGLIAAHAIGVVHRDLKPENILIDRYRRWRITDFGIAHMPGETTGGAAGTPAFASPEQLLGEAQGPAVDQFAMAAIVAFALTGRPPFGDADTRTILARQIAGQFDTSPYPDPIGEWLRRALAANPEDRFADTTAMKRAWRDAVASARRAARRSGWWRMMFGGEAAPRMPTPPIGTPAIRGS